MIRLVPYKTERGQHNQCQTSGGKLESPILQSTSKLTPTKMTDSDKIKMDQENVCRHFKVEYYKN